MNPLRNPVPRVERSIVEHIAYWDWDLSDIWVYFRDLIGYYWQTHGMLAMFVIAAVIVAILMSWEVTRNATAKVVETVVRTTIRTAIYTGTFVFIFGGRWLVGRFMVYGRWLWRAAADLLR